MINRNKTRHGTAVVGKNYGDPSDAQSQGMGYLFVKKYHAEEIT